MYRIKKTMSLLLAFLLCVSLFSLPASASEVIPEGQIGRDETNYQKATAKYGDFYSVTTVIGFSFLSVDYHFVYKGDSVHYMEALVSQYEDVEAGDPIYRVLAEKDEVAITEKELNIRRLQEALQRDLAAMDEEISDLTMKKWSSPNADELRKAEINIEKKQLERERLVYEQERKISLLQKELDEMNEKAAVEYICSPYSGKVTSMASFVPNAVIDNGAELAVIRGESVMLASTLGSFLCGSEISIDATLANLGTIHGRAIISDSAIPDSGLNGTIFELEVDEELGKRILSEINGQNSRTIATTLQQVRLEGAMIDLKNVLIIPADGWEMDNGVETVEILGEDQMIHKRRVRIGAFNKDYVWVMSGLTEGDIVLLKN